ncbi:helix-turn-helix domain-containing protein [Sporohalobacter salinus]|uniref:helix-turn-helix domain-containing protein n=1 Tax=Sporohalobacter salinus TaxID=1494606 RepID=UPI00195FF8CE|nr:helix-turn-helix domain-containing protein [Sporohalobacter salinus]MBM7624795.1 excisionase family DNA binding protein [Sporohalobacter salinus]
MFESKKEYEQFLNNNVMSTKDAAKYLDITRKGISYLVKEGKLKPFKDQDRVRLFSRREIDRYKKERAGK